MVSPLLAVAALATCATIAYLSSQMHRKARPGPVGWPVVGNAFDIPRGKPWLQFTKWAKDYGAC
jgi:hypothetical protein